MNTKFNGQVAFINGGSRGIGAATARRLASDGAKALAMVEQAVDRCRNAGNIVVQIVLKHS